MRRDPPVPSERSTTARERILAILECGRSLTLKELSGEVSLSERDLPAHLEHLQRSLRREGRRLLLEPATCKRCGFVFRKRTRFTRPSRCPSCRGTHLDPPRVGLQT